MNSRIDAGIETDDGYFYSFCRTFVTLDLLVVTRLSRWIYNPA